MLFPLVYVKKMSTTNGNPNEVNIAIGMFILLQIAFLPSNRTIPLLSTNSNYPMRMMETDHVTAISMSID